MKRCQVGCGGRNALDDCHDILAECYGAIGSLDAEVRSLRDALVIIAELNSYYATTPKNVRVARKALGCKRSG